MSKFVKTQLFTGTESPKIGQWVKTELGQRGQYLGLTRSGTLVIRWQHSDASKFSKRDAVNNKHLRAFAKTYGAK